MVQQPLHGIKETIVHNKKDFFYKNIFKPRDKEHKYFKKYIFYF